MSEFKPSSKQQDIFNTWNDADNNILINAGPGSGKTTTLLELVKKVNPQKSALFLAFNKSIQNEIQDKLKGSNLTNCKAQTMHSLGLLSLRRFYNSNVKINVDSKCIYNRFTFLYSKCGIQLNFEDLNILKSTIIEMYRIQRTFLIEDVEELFNLACNTSSDSIYDIWEASIDQDSEDTLSKKLVKFYTEFVNYSYRLVSREVVNVTTKVDIDFLDMVYLPIKLDTNIATNANVLFIDEAQDLNLCQHKIIQKNNK